DGPLQPPAKAVLPLTRQGERRAGLRFEYHPVVAAMPNPGHRVSSIASLVPGEDLCPALAKRVWCSGPEKCWQLRHHFAFFVGPIAHSSAKVTVGLNRCLKPKGPEILPVWFETSQVKNGVCVPYDQHNVEGANAAGPHAVPVARERSAGKCNAS